MRSNEELQTELERQVSDHMIAFERVTAEKLALMATTEGSAHMQKSAELESAMHLAKAELMAGEAKSRDGLMDIETFADLMRAFTLATVDYDNYVAEVEAFYADVHAKIDALLQSEILKRLMAIGVDVNDLSVAHTFFIMNRSAPQ